MSAVSVLTCAYSEDRWDDLVRAVGSVARQTQPPLETILVIDHNDTLLQRARERFPDARVERNARARGASGARNTACDLARGEILAFLDDDAHATETWLEELIRPFDDPTIAGVGGKALPGWPGKRPSWFPEEFDWVVGCSYRGLPTSPSAVRNLIGTNMSVRRDLMIGVGGFREGFGNIAGAAGEPSTPRLSTAEETEFCIRIQQQYPGMRWLYTPSAVVTHRIPPYRTTFRYFVSRCWIEGGGKAQLSGLTGRTAALSSERAYALELPKSVLNETSAAIKHRDVARIGRAAAIIVGLSVTGVGFLVGQFRRFTRA